MRKFFLSLLAMSLASFAWGDDAVEAVATSGISFQKTPDIIMQDETLTISKLENQTFTQAKYSVDVDFHFQNTGNKDHLLKVVFALPPVQCQMDVNTMWRGLESSQSAEDNTSGLADFTTTVDGAHPNMTIRREAKLKGRDITPLLMKLQIPLNPCDIKMQEGKPENKYRGILEKNQLLTKYNDPAWVENIYYEWQQSFPANKVVHIQHHYTPVIGATVPSSYSMTDLNRWFAENKPAFTPIWNRDPMTLATTNSSIVNKKADYGNDHSMRFCLTPSWVRYRLTTGAYWQGGIGVFNLVIKDAAGAPFAVNQFYPDGTDAKLVKSENKMTVTLQHFIPQKDLLVLFLSLPKVKNDFEFCGME